jgi:DNA polymerase-2
MSELSTDIFLLTGECFDYNNQNVIRFFGTSDEFGTVEVLINNKPVFFVERKSEFDLTDINYIRKEVHLKNFEGNPVDAIYFNRIKDYRRSLIELNEKGITTFESDVDPVKRYLMEKFINVQMKVTGNAKLKGNITRFINPKVEPSIANPSFVIASLDIETSGKSNILYSIAVFVTGRKGEHKKVFMIGDPPKNFPQHLIFFNDEKELLINFFKWFNDVDPDIIIGWHIIGFDLLFLDNKCRELNINFDIGRNGNSINIRKRENRGYFASLPGRVIIDGPTALRTSFYNFEDFKLETVAQEVLGIGKTINPEKTK